MLIYHLLFSIYHLLCPIFSMPYTIYHVTRRILVWTVGPLRSQVVDMFPAASKTEGDLAWWPRYNLCSLLGPQDHINIRISHPSSSNIRGIPHMLVCKILVLMQSLGAPIISARSAELRFCEKSATSKEQAAAKSPSGLGTWMTPLWTTILQRPT